MDLTGREWSLMALRLVQAKSGVLDARGEQELRFLLAKQSSSAATMGLQELVDLARFAIGLHSLQRLAAGETVEATA